MIYANVDTQNRAIILTEMKKTTDAKWYRRLKIVDLSGAGQTVPELAQLFDLSAATIRRYIHCFNDAGLAGLRPAYGRGRPPLLNWTKDQWLDVLAQSPADIEPLNTAAQNWTQALLRQYLETCHEVEVTQTTISKALRRAGVRWRRAVYIRRTRSTSSSGNELNNYDSWPWPAVSLVRVQPGDGQTNRPNQLISLFWTAPTYTGIQTSVPLMERLASN